MSLEKVFEHECVSKVKDFESISTFEECFMYYYILWIVLYDLLICDLGMQIT